MSSLSAVSILLVAGLLLLGSGWLLARSAGAEVSLGRRLGGARPARVGDLLAMAAMPRRPVRVSGRIRCPDPIVTERDDRLVAFHRDVEVRLAGGTWRTIERVRLTRGFELWDHAGSLPLDPALAAEPLVSLPHVWRGAASELSDPAHRAAIDRLEAQYGPVAEARAVTRTVSVIERLLVLARVSRAPDGGVALQPPPGGYVISTLELDDAMRLLGGPRRRRMLAGVTLGALGAAAVLAAAIAALVAWLTA